MKRLMIFIGVIAALSTACKNEDYPVYDVNQKDGVFLAYDEETDSVFYNFGFDSKTEYIQGVTIKLLGMPRDYDRTVKLKVNNGKYADDEFVAAKEAYYELPSTFTFPKDSVQATIPVKLIRDAELEDVRAILTFELEESDDLAVRGHSEFTITFDDKLPLKPEWWTTYDLGDFTKFKGQLFFQYFWEMEQENKYLFDKIVARWGRNLDIPPFTPGYANSPLVIYETAFNLYVKMKMWEYSEAHPELELRIQKPTIY